MAERAQQVGELAGGTHCFVITELLPDDRPLFAAAVRALPVGLVFVLRSRKLPRCDCWWKAITLGALNIGAFFGLLFVAASRLPGGVAATAGAVQPLIAAALAAWGAHGRGLATARESSAGGRASDPPEPSCRSCVGEMRREIVMPAGRFDPGA
jgi:hypothetical protein